MAMSQGEIEALLGEPRVSVLGTVDPDGSPALAPVWHLWRDGAAIVLTDRSSRKWRNIRANPRVSLCVDTKEAPYRAAIVEGTATEVEDDYAALLREAAVHYLGERAGNRYAERSSGTAGTSVVVRIVPERIVSWAY